MLLATQIEHAFTKDEILELYLNKVYFGDGFHGVEAASRGYFAKSAKRPRRRAGGAARRADPVAVGLRADRATWQRALARRGTVLQAMLDDGAIDACGVRTRAHGRDVVLNNGLQRDEDVRALLQGGGAARAGRSLRVGARVRRAACASSPPSSSKLQAAGGARWSRSRSRTSRAARRTRTRRASAVPVMADEAPPYLQAAVVVLEPVDRRGAGAGGRPRLQESRFNRATQAKRQPGSAFKPVLYAAAIEGGMSPADVLDRARRPGARRRTGAWMPEDEHSRQRGDERCARRCARRATARRRG